MAQKAVLTQVWSAMYWVNFGLCWLVLPVLSTYFDSCEFTFVGKFCYAVKYNIIYIMIGLGGLVLFIIIYACSTGSIDFELMKSFMMAMSSAWALVQIILFLSNGLVSVPRELWRAGNNTRKFRTICCRLMQMQELLDEYKNDIENNIKKLQAIEMIATPENKALINKIYDLIPEDLTSFRSLTGTIDPDEEVGSSAKSTRAKIMGIFYDVKTLLHEFSVRKRYIPPPYLPS
jgi:hypothetical protein